MSDNIKPDITFKELSEKNLLRCLNDYKSKVYEYSAMEWGCKVAGETGELCNVLKKLRRIEDKKEQYNKESETEETLLKQAADEIGDVVIYLDLLAKRIGLNLSDCVKNKFNYNSELIKSKYKI